jgi:hypothetical protein
MCCTQVVEKQLQAKLCELENNSRESQAHKLSADKMAQLFRPLQEELQLSQTQETEAAIEKQRLQSELRQQEGEMKRHRTGKELLQKENEMLREESQRQSEAMVTLAADGQAPSTSHSTVY